MTLDAHTHFELVKSNSNFVFYQININQSEFTYWKVEICKKKQKEMKIWNCDICVWHPPTFYICHNFFFKRNYVLKQEPTHLLVQCHKIRSFFEGFPKWKLSLFFNFFELFPNPVISYLIRANPAIIELGWHDFSYSDSFNLNQGFTEKALNL